MSCGCGFSANPFWLGNGVWRCGRCGEDCLAVRPQGPQGDPGPPGITPSFQVGTVGSGGTPSVQVVEVSATLYTLDFILPEAYTFGDNIWTGTNTFNGDVTVTGAILTASQGITTSFLIVQNAATFNSTVTVNGNLILSSTSTLTVAGTSTFNGDVTMNGPVSVPGTFTATGPVSFTGDVTFHFPALGLGVARGRVVIDDCSVLKYLEGTGFTAAQTVNNVVTTTVHPGDSETSLCTPLTISMPAFGCSPTETQYIEVMARVECIFGFGATGDYTINLWGGSIGGNLLDSFKASPGIQEVILRQILLALTPGGTLTVFVSCVPGPDTPDQNFVSTAVKLWVK